MHRNTHQYRRWCGLRDPHLESEGVQFVVRGVAGPRHVDRRLQPQSNTVLLDPGMHEEATKCRHGPPLDHGKSRSNASHNSKQACSTVTNFNTKIKESHSDAKSLVGEIDKSATDGQAIAARKHMCLGLQGAHITWRSHGTLGFSQHQAYGGVAENLSTMVTDTEKRLENTVVQVAWTFPTEKPQPLDVLLTSIGLRKRRNARANSALKIDNAGRHLLLQRQSGTLRLGQQRVARNCNSSLCRAVALCRSQSTQTCTRYDHERWQQKGKRCAREQSGMNDSNS